MNIKEEFLKLKQTDMYSLILFTLYKLKDIPEYCTLSELIYILDKESLLKLCEYFGGLTIHIPTLDELEDIVYSLLIFQKVELENLSIADAVQELDISDKKLPDIKKNYCKVKEILSNYNFGRDAING